MAEQSFWDGYVRLRFVAADCVYRLEAVDGRVLMIVRA